MSVQIVSKQESKILNLYEKEIEICDIAEDLAHENGLSYREAHDVVEMILRRHLYHDKKERLVLACKQCS